MLSSFVFQSYGIAISAVNIINLTEVAWHHFMSCGFTHTNKLKGFKKNQQFGPVLLHTAGWYKHFGQHSGIF